MSSPRSQKPLWMTLDELSHASDFAARVADEFPQGAAVWNEGLSRRNFLQLMGASLALAGLNGCMRLPEQKIVPYTEQPEKLIPGKPLHFATTLQINNYPRGVLVTQNEGRPTHIAGNPLHPMSLGASDVWTTASLLDLYDPDRLQTVRHGGNTTSWSAFVQAMLPLQDEWAKTGGAGLCVLTPPVNSPTELRLLRALLSRFPQARWYAYDCTTSPYFPAVPFDRLDLTNADVIFSLESDFLYDRPDSLALCRAFSQRRSRDDAATRNRLYVVESSPTLTGSKADHRFAVPPQDLDSLIHALSDAVRGTPSTDPRWPWLGALVEDLQKNGDRALIIAGRSLSETQRILLDGLAIGSGSAKSIAINQGPIEGLSHLVARMEKGEVGTLLMLGGNPVYEAPADFAFSRLLSQVPISIHHPCHANETSVQSAWVINGAHDLETWGDAEATDGTFSIAQPLIAPLYNGKSRIELLALLAGTLDPQGYDLVRETWHGPSAPATEAFEREWHSWLRDGVVRPNSATSAVASSTTSLQVESFDEFEKPTSNSPQLCFRPSAALWDGRHANNGWLQELPDPVTKLTWDNAVWMSPTMAAELKVTDGVVVILHARGQNLEAPVLTVPGHAERCVTLSLGYGRTVCGGVGNSVGANANLLRFSDAFWQVPLDKIERTGRTHPLARTQEHFRMEGRDLLHVSRVDAAQPDVSAMPPTAPLPSLYPEIPYDGHRWAMTINLDTCIGCNACIVACQSENNIPVVGEEQVLMGREMQWIRVDRYYQGDAENPRTHFQPVTCMQCEKAPCEVVCPVAATQHDDEGLNVMVYNRCVGTRYCSNNCPYKVRRFNFLFYNADIPPTQRLRLNPNVTVRSRGVMEKCTYCVQRIEEARIEALRQHRNLRGDDIVTACQASCPAEAIVFGDLSDTDSAVSKNRRRPGHYAMLAELDTQPRTTYLEKRINPNPALEPPETKSI